MNWTSLPATPQWKKIQYSSDQTTERLGSFLVRKYTFENPKALFAEGHTRLADDWAMMYLSTISGCPVKCKMCGTAETFSGMISKEQMIDQIEVMMQGMDLTTRHKTKLIKWMYMGEPMLNAHQFIPAFREILERYPDWNHVISTTCPTVNYDALFDIAREFGNRIEFTISIHGLTEESRNLIIPYRQKHTIQGAIELGERWFEITGVKVSYSYNLCNSAGLDKEADKLTSLFCIDKWIPCIQYMHTISSDNVHLENRTNEELCDLSDAKVDAFMDKLRERGYTDVKGFYTNRDKLERGCGSLIEYQKFLTR
ncbi:MAG: radical SAM protein [Vibrio splendidus]